MTINETLATDVGTDPQDLTPENQAPAEKTYTQREMDDMAAKLKTAVARKVQKQYEDLGDIEELRALRQQADKTRVEEATKKGDFERVIQEIAAKKDAEIQKRDAIIKEYKIDTPLLSTAAKYRAVAPEQVKALLKNNLRLSEDGEVEVLDQSGQVRYTDAGNQMSVDELVIEWLDKNPHFVQATPATTQSRNSIDNSRPGPLDITKLDMKNPEHRAQYAEYRKKAGIA
jgi:hypothetical protein